MHKGKMFRNNGRCFQIMLAIIINFLCVHLSECYLLKNKFHDTEDVKSSNFEHSLIDDELLPVHLSQNLKEYSNYTNGNNLNNRSSKLKNIGEFFQSTSEKSNSTHNESDEETNYFNNKVEGRKQSEGEKDGEKDGDKNGEKEDIFDKMLKKFDEGRLIKFDGSILVPTLMGILLKIATVIPIVLAISTVVGTVSLLGSKLALLISGILGARTLIQYFNALNPPPQNSPPITQSDMMDIQNIITKSQMSSDPIRSMAMPLPVTPPSLQLPLLPTLPPLLNLLTTSAPTTTTTSATTTTQATTTKPLDVLNYFPSTKHPLGDMKPIYSYPGLSHFSVTNPDVLVDFGLKDSLYHPENYFVHHPTSTGLDHYDLNHHHNLGLGHLNYNDNLGHLSLYDGYSHLNPHTALGHLNPHTAYSHINSHDSLGHVNPHDDLVHAHDDIGHAHNGYHDNQLKRIDGNPINKNKLVNKLKNIQRVSDKDVVKKVSELLKNSGNKQNVISKVKIVKTVRN